MKVTAKLMHKGRRVGFVFDTTEKLKDYDIHMRMSTGQDLGLKFTGNGFRLTDGRRISDLPEIKLEKVIFNKGMVDVYAGDRLKNFVRCSEAIKFKKRDFVGNLVRYLRGHGHYVYGVAGLRGVGKTTGILQAIDYLNLYNDAIYITMDRNASVDINYIYDIINRNGKKYVFIDEVTTIVNLISGSCFLYDRYINNGYRVVISGTDSYALYASNRNALFHRMYIDTITFISYPEVKRLLGFNLKDYLDMGGIYKAMPIENVNGLLNYIDTSVVDNIENTITRNSITYGNVPNREEIRSGILIILYSVIISRVTSDKRANFSSMVNLIDETINKDEVLNSLSIDLGTTLDKVSSKLINTLLGILKQIGLLIEVDNISNDGGSKYYITNPGVVNQIYYSVFRSFRRNNYELNKALLFDGVLSMSRVKGLVLESMIMCQVRLKTSYALYYYRDRYNREIDLVVTREGNEVIDDGVICYEVKLAEDINKAYNKAKWLVGRDIYEYFGTDYEIADRAVIYTGKTSKKEGIQFINAGDFLLNTEKILGSVLRRKREV